MTAKDTPNSETLTGTGKADNIIPFNGDDTVYEDPPVKPIMDPPSFSKGAGDTVHHSYGKDKSTAVPAMTHLEAASATTKSGAATEQT